MLTVATQRTRLFLLLMLNCGYYQSDLAELRPFQVDWRLGRIKRKRTKTEDLQNVPVVDYPLWDETFDLLRGYGRTEGDRVFLNENGDYLMRWRTNGGGTLVKIDNISDCFKRACDRLTFAVERLMDLRKTSASKLEEHEVYGRYAEYFLGKAPSSDTGRSCARPSQDIFDRSVIWLGEQFGFRTDRPLD